MPNSKPTHILGISAFFHDSAACLVRDGDLSSASADELARQLLDAPEKAASLLKHGDSKRDESLSPAEHAAYTVLMNMLLNLDEVLTRG